jgi:endoglucanase
MHNAIKWALAAKLRVIVDLHIIRSHYFNAASNILWTDPAAQQKLLDMWKQLSKELKKYPVNMLAYEIMNEAVADNPEDWNKLFNKAISEIRKTEPNRMIVIGSNRWQIPSTFPDLRVPENDKNIILSFHFYNPLALTHHMAPWTSIAEYKGPVNYPGQIIDTANYKGLSEATVKDLRAFANGFFTIDTLEKIISPAIKFAKEKNLQLFCGEFGIYPTIPENLQLQWYKDMCDIFNRNNIAYCHWCYKGDFPVVDVKTSTPNKKLVSVLTAK